MIAALSLVDFMVTWFKISFQIGMLLKLTKFQFSQNINNNGFCSVGQSLRFHILTLCMLQVTKISPK